jgi:hypothetical protein
MLSVLAEMRDLLRLIAEPAIAERDKKLREALLVIGGNATSKRAKAILLLDGTRTQADVTKDCGINKGDLSGLVKKLKAAELLKGDLKQPQLAISIPVNFLNRNSDEREFGRNLGDAPQDLWTVGIASRRQDCSARRKAARGSTRNRWHKHCQAEVCVLDGRKSNAG